VLLLPQDRPDQRLLVRDWLSDAEVGPDFFEGNVFDNTGSDWTIIRDTDANGIPVDTDDNSVDFHQISGSTNTRTGYSTAGAGATTISIDTPANNHDTSVQNISVDGHASNASAGDTVEVFVNANSESLTNVQNNADSSWRATGVTLSGYRDRVRAELDTNTVSPIADSDVIEVEFSDTNLLHVHNWDMEKAGADPPSAESWRELGTSSRIVQDCSLSHRTDCSLQFQDLIQSYGGREVASETVSVQPDEEYEAEAFLRLSNAGNASEADVRVQIGWYDSAGNELDVEPTVGSNLSDTGRWESLSFSAQAPSSAERARVFINAQEYGTQGFDLNIDQVTFINRTGLNSAPSVTLESPGQNDYVGGQNVSGTYVITDPDNDPGTITVDVSEDSGSTWSSATVSGELESVSTSSGGDRHTFSWDSLADLGTVEDTRVKLRIQANDGVETSNYDTSNAFTVDNRAPPRVDDLNSTSAVTPPDSGVHLTWTFSDDDVDTFHIYRTVGTGDTSQADLLAERNPTADTEYLHDTSATQGDSHFYYVTALDTAGNESDSSNRTTAPSVRFSKTRVDGSARPGDTVTYQIQYVNEGFGPTGSLTIVDAIPLNTNLADTATVISPPPNAQVEYSTDDGASWGTTSYPRSSIDQVRWIVQQDLNPRQSGYHGTVEVKVRVQ